jgi:membrane-associated phospholipid phosphatase
MVRLTCILLIPFCTVPTAFAGSSATGSVPPNESDFPGVHVQLLNDFNYLLKEPAFYRVVGLIGLAPGALGPVLGKEEPEYTEMWATESADRFFEAGEQLGEAYVPVGASILCLAIGRLGSDRRMTSFGSCLLRAQAINGIVTVAVKAAVGRPRPNGGAYSYPSGHTTSAFTTAAVVYEHFGMKCGIPAFAGATYIGLSRLQENMHYMSDVVAGAVLGSYIGFKIAGRHMRMPSMSVMPINENKDLGISLSLAL